MDKNNDCKGMSGMYLQDFMWKIFQSTGAIGAYLIYRQLKRNEIRQTNHFKNPPSAKVIF